MLAGNPGAGKSTLLNSMLRAPIFKSGVNIGEGMTRVVQLHTVGNLVYGDTPGLDDVKLREQAAAEIYKLMREVSSLKLAFVITLEAGRLRPADIETMNVILKSLNNPDIHDKFGIIINKLSAGVVRKLGDDGAERLFTSMNLGFATTKIIGVPLDRELADEDNAVAEPNPELMKFMRELPPIMVHEAIPLEINNYSEEVAQLRLQLDRIQTMHKEELALLRRELQEAKRHRVDYQPYQYRPLFSIPCSIM